MAKSKTSRLVFQPQTSGGMQKGINTIANVVRPTVGPLPRNVGIAPNFGSKPELLDDGGLIARRIVELPDRDADVGAMLIRQLLWQQHERAGDGTGLAALLFQSVYNQGLKYITAGGNAMRLRGYLEKGARVIIEQVQAAAIPLEGAQRIAQLAESICFDPEMAAALGEIFDVIGEHGQLEIRQGRSREIEREYIPGAYFKGGVLFPKIVSSGEHVTVYDAPVLITDHEIEDPAQILPALERVYKSDYNALLIVAKKMSDKVLAVLNTISRDPQRFRVITVKAPDAISGQAAFLDDLAILTGGRVFLKVTGDTLDAVQLDDLGQARRIWADKEHLSIIGGKGSASALKQHVAYLRATYQNADSEMQDRLRQRIGKLMGGSAALWVGGLSEILIKERKALAERTAQALRSALMHGVIPGAGVTLLACRPQLEAMAEAADDLDERMAYRILSRALEAPARTILQNAGHNPGPIINRIDEAANESGFDVRSGELVDMAEAGIYDSAGVVIAASHNAIASAALALTVDVIVHHKKQQASTEP